MEKTNLLMKLRQTLLDHKQSGEEVTEPSGMSIFPYNVLYFWFCILFSLFLIPAILILRSSLDD
ncbi:hypothetical protein EXS71_03310 [Candidatus Uhrbacteria bacterium]|nr:hypothetical protein [Candidatus Uhrbacteria bacterium]